MSDLAPTRWLAEVDAQAARARRMATKYRELAAAKDTEAEALANVADLARVTLRGQS